jgi:hypothetical protein
MSKPIVVIHNLETNEIIEREMNAEEFAQWEKDQAQNLAEKQAQAELAEAKEALLNRLGITADEAKLLLS